MVEGTRWIWVLLLSLALAGCTGPPGGDGPAPPGEAPANVTLVPVTDDLTRPLHFTETPDGTRLVVEQGGLVRVLTDQGLRSQPYLDIRDRVRSGGERGLLGIAFPDDFGSSGRAYVSYTDRQGDSVLARYHADEDGLDPASEEVLLTLDQPYANHNGGHVAFGPDGHLHLGLGDGGSGGDPQGNGQDPSTLLGSILRLDVSGDGYRPPPSNPFVGEPGRDEIWAYGLRNPWRFSFDPDGNLWIGDVGQDRWEEIDREPAGSDGGQNYGWNVYEGNHRFGAGSAPDAVFPVAEYPNDADECSVTGGHVYTGDDIPTLGGFYVFGDFCSGRIWTLPANGTGGMAELADTDLRISSFGVDGAGELYVVDHGGSLHRLAPDSG